MKLRNLITENPNYSVDSKIALFGNKIDAADSEKYDWYVEYRVQRIIESRLKIVIDKTPHDVLAFAQSEVNNLSRLLENTLNNMERRIYCSDWSISEYIDTTTKTWKIDVVTRYKQYLETFINDDCILEADQPTLDDEELIFKELFSSSEELKNNLVIEYRYFERGYKEETYGEYSIISVAGCYNPAMFLAKINKCAEEGINNLKAKLIRTKGQIDKKQLISETKQIVYKYKDVIASGHFSNVKFQGNVGWKLAFNNDTQVSIQQKIPDFIRAWDSGISELMQKIIFIEVNPQEDKPMPVTDIPIKSFKYKSIDSNGKNNSEDKISSLFNSLKNNKLIDDLTNKHKFRNVFVRKEITDKVVWIGDIDTLKYFINKLVLLKKIDKKTKWKITHVCFSNNGVDFTTEQLKQAKKPATKKVQIIDWLTSNL